MTTDDVTVANAVQCGICGSLADRIGGPEKVYGHHHPSSWYFRCQANPGHQADGFTGIFSDLSYSPPGENKEVSREG